PSSSAPPSAASCASASADWAVRKRCTRSASWRLNPSTSAISSALAARIRLSEPKWLSSPRLRLSPMPGISSSIERKLRSRRSLRDVELAFSAVDHQQVGQVLLLDSALQPAGKDLEHGSEVVSGRLAAHLEEPVAALVGLAVAEHDLRADGELALEGGDVEALDPSREPRQPQPRLQPRERLQLALLRARLFLVALARVLHRHVHQPHLLAALRHVHAHALALLLRQPDLAHL